MKISILVIMSFLILPSCRNGMKNGDGNQTVIQVDSFKKDIPIIEGKPRGFVIQKREIEQSIGFNLLEDGYDSLAIRIWFSYSSIDTAQVLVLQKSKGIWSADFTNIYLTYNDKRDSILKVEKTMVTKTPKNGWKSIEPIAFDTSLMKIRDMNSITDYPITAEGDAIIVEIATKDRYRIFSFIEPESAALSGIADARSLAKFVENLRTQLDLNLIRTPQNSLKPKNKIKIVPTELVK